MTDTSRRSWFEISDDGWSRMSSSRPLGRLLLEAIQNALDAGASSVSVELDERGLVVEDDAEAGIVDERLVYTLFLSEKPLDPTRRGRMGRGLKELLAAAERASVETMGATIHFDEGGRRREANTRARGTRIVVRRPASAEDRAAAEQLVRMVVAPTGVTVRVSGRAVRRPRLVLSLPGTDLETVVVDSGVERAAMRTARLDVFSPRRGEEAHLFEMGIPIQAWNVPWHCDVDQRVPLSEGRMSAPERYVLSVKAALLDAMIHRLDRHELRADWVQDVVARWPVTSTLLDAYVSKVFPRGSVLGGGSRANDRARQLGAHVVDAGAVSHGAWMALGRVLETADDFVRRRAHELQGEPVEADATQAAFAESVRWIARKLAGSVIRVRFFAKDPTETGLLEDALTDVTARIVSFNVRSALRFDDILDPATLGVVLHELAHLVTPEHDTRFIDRLQFLGGAMARLLAETGPALGVSLRRGDVEGLSRFS